MASLRKNKVFYLTSKHLPVCFVTVNDGSARRLFVTGTQSISHEGNQHVLCIVAKSYQLAASFQRLGLNVLPTRFSRNIYPLLGQILIGTTP